MNLSQVTNLGGLAWTWAAEFIPNLLVAILVVMAGFYIAGLASRGIRTLLSRSSHSDTTLVPVLAAVVRYAITIFVVIAALSQLGVETTSLLAILGAAGLAVGLALQGTLANIAAGIMLLWLRPFRVGDYIEVSSAAGTVEEINLFHSRLRTWDGIYKFVPNSQLWNTTLTNYTRNRTRLILIEFGIAYEDDIATGRAVLAEQAINHPSVLNDPPVAVVPLSLGDSSVNLQLRAWCTTAKFWDTRWDLTMSCKKALEHAGITIPFPQRVVHWADSAPPPPRPPSPPPPSDAAAA